MVSYSNHGAWLKITHLQDDGLDSVHLGGDGFDVVASKVILNSTHHVRTFAPIWDPPQNTKDREVFFIERSSSGDPLLPKPDKLLGHNEGVARATKW